MCLGKATRFTGVVALLLVCYLMTGHVARHAERSPAPALPVIVTRRLRYCARRRDLLGWCQKYPFGDELRTCCSNPRPGYRHYELKGIVYLQYTTKTLNLGYSFEITDHLLYAACEIHAGLPKYATKGSAVPNMVQ
jgi:hypothetical protein